MYVKYKHIYREAEYVKLTKEGCIILGLEKVIFDLRIPTHTHRAFRVSL